MDYTVEEDDHYYFFYYLSSTYSCNGEFIGQEQAGILSIYIDKFEYSTSGVQFDGVCNTYEVYSFNVNIPLRTSEMVLITVQGQPDDSDKYAITFTYTTRKWLIAVIVIGSILLL